MSPVQIALPRHASYLYVSLLLLSACGRVGVQLLDAPDPAGMTGQDDAGPGDVGMLDTGVSNTCPTTCENLHGGADCSAGSCLVMCSLGYQDCDGTPANGCETDTSSGGQSCGSCARACLNAHGETSCRSGLCAPVCGPGFADCDSDPSNGCEADLSSPSSCGSCDKVCLNAHGSTSCGGAACSPTCAPGFEDCDGDRSNGCEVSLQSDPTHCGACATACNLDTQVCSAGQCQISPCAPGRGECDGNAAVACETDLTSTLSDCGFCGNVCTLANANATCAASTCTVASCRGSYGNCDALASTGCEAALSTSTAHCGSCATVCTNAHGSVSCAASVCAPTCSSGYGDCDASRPNGCETALNTASNCGMCGRVCPANGGTAVCSAGVCSTNCTLTGAYALKLSIPTTWPSTSVLSAGSGTFVWWSKLQLTQNGTALSGTLVPCGETVPDFAASSFIGESYGLVMPNSVFDGTPLASTATSGSLSAVTPGSTLTLARSALLVGLTMADPINGAWPSSAALMQVDADGNGKPGITAPYKSGGSYDAPPANSVGSSRASAAYLATRAVLTLSGTLTSCTQSSGSATVQDIDFHTLGCTRTAGGDCSAGESSYLDGNAPNYRTSPATYTLVKLLGSNTCADVRAAAP